MKVKPNDYVKAITGSFELDVKEPVLRERKYLRRAIKWVWAFI